jgi:glucosylceramidase
MPVAYFSSSENSYYQAKPLSPTPASGQADLALDGSTKQTWEGWGGCFNELGWEALAKLTPADRDAVMDDLFAPQADGLRLTIGRMPIGANDYSLTWYSLDEVAGDYDLKHFSLERDELRLIPYLREGLKRQPKLVIFASPWSPPTWMKFPAVYNHGTIVQTPQNLTAYANYFLRFVAEYRQRGITIQQVHVQNEPYNDAKFPSCCWTGETMRDFIGGYLGPVFKQAKESCEIWYGTINYELFDKTANVVLSDPVARSYTAGVGYQWAGKGAIQRTHQAFPGVRIWQTENECGDGTNTWTYARYVFDLIQHYVSNGASAYAYWNMVLEPEGRSSWGWTQNAMITVDPATKKAIRNPEFWVFKHCARWIQPGAVRLGLEGAWSANALAFRNPDRSLVVVAINNLPTAQRRSVVVDGQAYALDCAPGSLHTLVIT